MTTEEMSGFERIIVAVLLMFILVSILGCSIVKTFAEPVDETVCHWDCARKDLTFLSYDYEDHRCKCIDADGNEVTLYE